MRVLQVMAGARHGGAEKAFEDISIALAQSGMKLEIVTRPHNERLTRFRAAGITVHTLPFGGVFDFMTPYRLKAIIETFRPQIVQTWMSRATNKTPAAGTSGGGPQYRIVSRLGGYYKLKNYKKTDYFVANTPDIKRFIIENGIPADRVAHINNFAEAEQADQPADRAALDTPEGVPLILALGRLHQVKALDTLLKAMPHVPGAYLWIAGEGPLRGELEALCTELALHDRVRFLGWREDRAALFQAADICAFPSRFEPFGNVVAQAWAQKTPLVTTEAVGPKQYVRHGEDGLIVPIDEPESLAAAIRQVIESPTMAAKLVRRGYERYEQEFTKEKTVQAYRNFYESIISQERLAS